MSGADASERVLPATLPNWLFIACGLSWGAAVIHVSAAISHAGESGLYTLFFALLAPIQLGWGLLMCRSPSRRLLLAGCLLSLAVVVVWAMSRTFGMPIGPKPWHPEAVGLVDSLASLDELTIVLLAWSCGAGFGGGDGLGASPDRGWRAARAVRAGAQLLGVVLILLSSLALLAAGHAS
jgi:hypothetical protein